MYIFIGPLEDCEVFRNTQMVLVLRGFVGTKCIYKVHFRKLISESKSAEIQCSTKYNYEIHFVLTNRINFFL